MSRGDIAEFSSDLGIGTVNGLAVDPETSIACTTTSLDQGVEFYDLTTEAGFEVQIPNAGSATQAGLDIEFDSIQSYSWSHSIARPVTLPILDRAFMSTTRPVIFKRQSQAFTVFR